MYGPLEGILAQRLNDVRTSGLFKQERLIDSAQGTRVRLKDGREVLNLCANNYLGLADHPKVKAAAAAALARWGYGVASVRFICGTQTLHRELEEALSAFLGTEGTILYSSCWDANSTCNTTSSADSPNSADLTRSTSSTKYGASSRC